MEDYISNHGEPLALSFIKDICSKRQGRKNIVDQEKYVKQVTNLYLATVKSERKKQRAKREKGKSISQRKAFELIFRNNFDRNADKRKNYVVVANIDSENKTIKKPRFVANMEDLLDKVKSLNYFSNNMFYSNYHFTADKLRHLVSIVLDFDLDTQGISMTKDEIHDYIKGTIGVAPALVWDTKTKGNYQAIILIESMSGTGKSVHLYEEIIREMVYRLKYADKACINANHLFSVPRSNNDRKIRLYNESVHSIDDFRWLLDERDKHREEELANGNVVEFAKRAIRKHPAIQALFNGEILERTRNNACFTLALVMRELGYSESECDDYIVNEWYPRVKKRSIDKDNFTRKERDKCVKKAYSGKFKSFHSDYVEMVTGIECNLRGYFGRYQSQGIYKLNNAEKVIEFLRKQENRFEGNLQDIADAIGANKRTLERTMRELRSEGVVLYQSAKGRGKKAMYTLQESVKPDVKPNKEAKNVRDIGALRTELQTIEEDVRQNPEKYLDRTKEPDWWVPIEQVDDDEIRAVLQLFKEWSTG